VRRVDRLQEGPLKQKLLAEKVVPHRLAVDPARRFERSQVEHLARVIPLVNRRRCVQALVALQPDQRGLQDRGQHLGDLGLADPRFPFQQQRFPQSQRQVERRRQPAIGDVLLRP
jgi:hypothetical protein